MARLVVLSEGFTGRTHELKPGVNTMGRADDNAFSITEASVSGHHCEIEFKNGEVHVKDLGSTNGTFVNNDKVSESALKPGEILRLGQIEMRLETGDAKSTDPQSLDQTMVIPKGKQGVKLNELEGTKEIHFGKNNPFKKQSDKATKLFLGAALLVGVATIILLVIAITKMGK